MWSWNLRPLPPREPEEPPGGGRSYRRLGPRSGSVPLLAAVLLAWLPAAALAQPRYDITTEGRAHAVTRSYRGQPTLFVTVQFTIRNTADGRLASDVAKDEIVVREDGQPVADLDIYRPRASDPLRVVLALDTSGSMAQERKLAEAQQAARLFLDMLGGESAAGLILFDHQLRVVEPPAPAARDRLRQQVGAAQAAGGTAYLDATSRAVELLGPAPGRKAVLVLTDGIDLNSQARLPQVIDQAERAGVPIYTVGVGPPGKQEPVSTVLVLDRSGSMSEPAGDGSATTKIAALQRAAGRFLDLSRPGARVALLPFSTTAAPATPFLAEKSVLAAAVARLEPDGETALLDALYDAVETLAAARPASRRAVVALTDGIDTSSRRRVEEVIDRARQTRTPLHLLGLGRPDDLDEPLLRRLAQASAGSYHPAQSADRLVEGFENLAILLHDEGFDQHALATLAERTGGKFLHARQADELAGLYRGLAEELQSTYTVTFPSRRQVHDGTSRGIDIRVVRNGVCVSGVAELEYQVHGVVVPQLDSRLYLAILAALAALLALPGLLRRWGRRRSAA